MIELREITLSYQSTDILAGINYIFEPTEFTCVIGKNGCGKSTLLRAMAGLSHYTGKLLLDGVELSSISRQDRAKRISYLPQTRPIPAMDVETLIAHGRYPHLGFSKTLTPKDRQSIEYAASVTGVTSLLRRGLYNLSGGERQRAYIAMMIAQNAEIMLLDEPTTHLDIEHQLDIMDLLRGLHQSGKSVIMAAHDLPQALSYATRVLLLDEGRVAASGKTEELCENQSVKSAFGVTLKKASDELYSYKMTRGV